MNREIGNIDELLQENSQLKRELDIESSLERVRTVALAMKEPVDMPEVCKIIAQQLDKLGVKEIRNVQTAIFYESKGTYMNYEYYVKHDKTIITETSYTNHKIHQSFADKMLKGPGEISITHIPGSELKEWIAYQKTTNVFIDSFLETASSLNYYWHSLGPVALGISTYAPLSKEDLNLFKRFLNVFELAYTRYLDIEQAIAQAREAQIQLALERVRARTMAMQKSDELPETSHILFEQMKELGEPVEQMTIGIVHEENNVIEISATLFGDTLKKIYLHSIEEPYMMTKIYKAWKTQQKTLIVELKGDELNSYNKYRNELTNSEMFPTNFGNEHRRIVYAAFFSKGMLALGANEPCPPQSLQLLERFASVFDLTYTRFLDLQKAEAQAREAQIEAALERVRSKAMSMQKSEDLANAVGIAFEELDNLNPGMMRCGIAILNKEKQSGQVWTTTKSDNNTVVQVSGDQSMDIHPLLQGAFKAWLNQEADYNYILKGDDLNNYYKTLTDGEFRLPDSQSLVAVKEGLVQYYYAAVFSSGGLFAFRETEFPEEAKIVLQRFADVFNLTYTRFNDLQKAERQTRESELEKKRSEDLLLNILPREIANELKQFGKSYARKHEQVSILFTDIKGFSTISENLSAEELVNQLDECFRAFDHIVGKHGLEKIKTIGDAYICACGLPNPDPDNAIKTVRAAIDMLDFAKGFGMTKIIQDLPAFEFRVGIHTGPVITGVVGLKKFTYDIWGDAVNMAARMEQHGEAGRINISGTTYQLIKDKFICTYRGKILAKNKGEVDMYFVEKANN